MRANSHTCGGCLAIASLILLFANMPATAQKTRLPWEEARAVQIEAARREGIPTTLKDFPDLPIPPDQNAATYLAKIRELDKASPVSREDIMALEDAMKIHPTPEQITLGRKALEAHRERFRLIHQVALSPDYVEPLKPLDLGGATLMDDFQRHAQFRSYARWLAAESMLLLEDGKPLEAIQVNALVFRLAHHFTSIGSLITYLVGEAIDAIGLGGMRAILYREGQNAGVAEAVRKALETQRTAPNLAASLRGEVVTTLVMQDAIRRDIPKMLKGEPGDKSQPPFEKSADYRTWRKKYGYPTDPKLALSRYLDMNDAHYLEWMRRILPLLDLPYPEALAGITAITREAEKNSIHPDYSLAATQVGVYSKLPARKAQRQATVELVRAAAALLAFKARQGHFPDTLAEGLTPVPLDPFDLHALRYRKEGEGFVLYSIGESGKFDGGRPDQKQRAGESLFRYPLPQ